MRRKRTDPAHVMFWWAVAGAVSVLVFGKLLVDHPDIVRHESAVMPPLIEIVPN